MFAKCVVNNIFSKCQDGPVPIGDGNRETLNNGFDFGTILKISKVIIEDAGIYSSKHEYVQTEDENDDYRYNKPDIEDVSGKLWFVDFKLFCKTMILTESSRMFRPQSHS